MNNQKVLWQPEKTFHDVASNLVVKIQKLPLYRPLYSYEVGRMNKDSKFIRFLYSEAVVALGKVALRGLDTEALVKLIAEAELYIHEKMQAREDQVLASREERELRQVNGKQETKHTGKTAKKKEKNRPVLLLQNQP